MSQKKFPWLDLSSYDLKMSVVILKSGARVLVMSDGPHAKRAAEALGFQFNKNAGFWVMKGSTFNPKAFFEKLQAAGFDQVKPVLLEPEKVMIDLAKRQAAQKTSVHQDQETTGTRNADRAHEPEEREAERPQVDPFRSAERLVSARYLGRNRVGQEVYEDASGRFAKTIRNDIIPEGDVKGKEFLFLRASDNASLALCADGLVDELERGRILRLDDFERFTNAAWGRQVARDEELYKRSFVAVEGALARKLAKTETRSLREAFGLAQRLHEQQAFFSSLAGELSDDYAPIASPVSVAMQRLLGTEKDLEGKSLHVINPGSGNLVSHLPQGANVRVFEEDEDLRPLILPTARVSGARVSGDEADWASDLHLVNLGRRDLRLAEEVYRKSDLSLSRSDLITLVEGLSKRTPDGRSVISFTYGRDAEGQEEAQAAINWIARHYAIEGMADIDGTLSFGNPDSEDLRVLVVGERRPEPLPEAPEAAMRLRKVEDFPSIWTWTSEVASNRAKIANYHQDLSAAASEEGASAEEDRENNSFQTPYVSASRLGRPTTMIPRNLEGATRKALKRIVKKHGDIDTWLSNELAISKEKLAEVFSPEQIDAIALQIHAEENGRGFLLGDQTGIGKGRSLSAMMLRAALQGKKVLFMTERPSNLSDIWRDIMHIGADGEFSPLIMNANTKIIDEVTGNVLLKSPTKRVMDKVIEDGGWPKESNLILASYGQLSRKADSSEKIRWLIDAVDEDTLVVLDEGHNAASRTSNTSVNIDAIQDRAGSVVYSSATPAKTAKNMSFFRKLFPDDMNADELADIIRRGGETMQEVVATMLATDGVMIRREHDLSTCEFIQILDEQNVDRNCQYTDQMSEILSEMFYLSGEISRRANAINAGLENVMDNLETERQRRGVKSMMVNTISFGSPLAHISRLFMAALKIDKSVEIGLEELRTGGKPVFLVDNTLESLLRELYVDDEEEEVVLPDFKHVMHRAMTQLTKVRRRDGEEVDLVNEDKQLDWRCSLTEAAAAALPRDFLQADDEVDTFDQDFKAMMLEAIDKTIENARASRRLDEDELLSVGQARDRVIRQIDGLSEDPRQAAPQIRAMLADLPDTPNRLIERIRVMIDRLPPLPASAIDEIRERIEAEGYSVGEITGRAFEVREGRIIKRPRPDKVEVKNAFNRGDLDAAIINTAGATGVDMHASKRFPDQRRRTLIEVQPPMDVAKQIQAYGRVQRFDQVKDPRIATILTGLPIENRFAAMRNQKLRRLSANITANRDNAALLEDIPDIMNSVGDRVCTQYGEARPDLMRRLGLNLDEDDAPRENDNANEDQVDNKRSANTFLARLIMLPVDMQIQVSNELIAEFNATIEDLEARGLNTLKPKELKGTIHERESYIFEGLPQADEDLDISTFQQPVYAVEAREERPVKPARSDALARAMETGLMQLGAEGPDVFAERLERNRNRLLEPYLPLAFRSVEAAIDGGVGTVITASARLDRLIATLKDLSIGSKVTYTDFDGAETSGIVTNIKLPARGYEHVAAQYVIEMLQPGDSVPVSFKLRTLMQDQSFKVEEGVNGEEYDDILDLFDNAEEGTKVTRRTLLTGNLFRAMSLNVQHDNKLGTIHVYNSAENGRSSGLVVSPNFGRLTLLPVQLRDAQIAARALTMGGAAIFSTSTDRTRAHVSITPERTGDNYILKIPSARNAKWGHVRTDEDVLAMIEGKPSNRRRGGSIEVVLTAEQLPEAIETLQGAGVRFFTGGRMRTTVNEWAAELYGGLEVENEEENLPEARAA